LAVRKFGADIKTNSIYGGYGRFDKVQDFNQNTETDFGLLNGLGYPTLIEQNKYRINKPEIFQLFGPRNSSWYTSNFIDLV
jgi:hypothetical protein